VGVGAGRGNPSQLGASLVVKLVSLTGFWGGDGPSMIKPAPSRWHALEKRVGWRAWRTFACGSSYWFGKTEY